ncbi:MAG: chemotaxis protein CheX [Acidimicrobiales bacterium]
MMVTESEIVDVANAVWQTMLNMEVYAVEPDTSLGEGPYITATVFITDAVEGGVTMHMNVSAARELAALMFSFEQDDVTEDEITDAIGELVNMLGGNLKSLMAQPARLSLPSVTGGDSYRVSFPGAIVVNQLAVGFEGHVARVVLHERSDDEQSANYEKQGSAA